MSAWLAYLVVVSLLLALAARGLEGAAVLYGRPTRWGWAVALGSTLVLPIVALVARRMAPPTAQPDWLTELTRDVLPAASATPQSAGLLDVLASPGATRAAAIIWVVATIVVGLALVVTYARLRRERRGWSAARVCGTEVLVSPGSGPAVLGVLHPAIVVPAWLTRADAAMQQLVLQHEREHLRSGDQRLQLAGCVVLALMPWNPIVWWMLLRLRAAIEVDCDRRVLARGADFRSYGDVLLRVAGRTPMLPFVPALVQRRSLIERRIRTMTRRAPRFRSARALGLSGTAVVLVVAACATRAPVARAASVTVAPIALPDSTEVPAERAVTLVERRSVEAARVAAVREQPVEREGAPEADRRAIEVMAAVAGGPGARMDVIARTARLRDTDPEKAQLRERPRVAAPAEGGTIVLREAAARAAAGDASPLIIVDGVILSRGLPASDLSIRPQDIESIEVIKGAAAARMYGARAEGGVISIRTKRGRS